MVFTFSPAVLPVEQEETGPFSAWVTGPSRNLIPGLMARTPPAPLTPFRDPELRGGHLAVSLEKGVAVFLVWEDRYNLELRGGGYGATAQLFTKSMRGDTPKPGIIFCRAGPLEYRLPPGRECSGNPFVPVSQLALL